MNKEGINKLKTDLSNLEDAENGKEIVASLKEKGIETPLMVALGLRNGIGFSILKNRLNIKTLLQALDEVNNSKDIQESFKKLILAYLGEIRNLLAKLHKEVESDNFEDGNKEES